MAAITAPPPPPPPPVTITVEVEVAGEAGKDTVTTVQADNTIEPVNSNAAIIVGVILAIVALIATGAAAFFYIKYRAAVAATTKATRPMTNVAIAPADVTLAQATPNAQPPRAVRGWPW
jgi:hypothetical protein